MDNKKYNQMDPYELVYLYHYEQTDSKKKDIAEVLLKMLLDKLNELKPFVDGVYYAYANNLQKFKQDIIAWAVKYKKGVWDEFTVLRFAEYVLKNNYHKHHFEVNPNDTWYALMQILFQLPPSVEKDFITYNDLYRTKRYYEEEERRKNEPIQSQEEIAAIFERRKRNLPEEKTYWFEEELL